ncbi:MAG: NAD(P)/FAD-dependent oxidoreductase [Bdellovibrionales bacterium]
MTKETLTPDLCIIGAGSGGLSVAAGAAQLGLDTVLLEKDKMGGDCLNTGCVPSKALLAAGKRAAMHRKNDIKGIAPHEPEIDYAAVKDHVSDTIATIEPNDSPERFRGLGVNVILQPGKFISPDTLETDEYIIKAKKFIISTGSRAFVPPIQGLEFDKVFTNENIFELRDKPDHLLIIGGGPIGIEMAQAHVRLGCKVSVFDMGGILPRDDQKNVEIVREALINEGINLHENVSVKAVKHDGKDKVSLVIEKDGKEETIDGSHLLVAAGRKPNVDSLGLDEAGIKHDRPGITVTAGLKTSNPKVYAIGDVCGGPQFTHVAGYHAGIIIRQICFGIRWAKVDYTALPWVTYTDPELAQVGLTEAAAIEKYGKDFITVAEWKFDENDRAIAERATKGQIRVVTNKKGLILGASIVGPQAGELIGLWALAISSKQKIGAITGMIAPYPTLGEASKRAAGAWYTPTLFSDKTRRVVKILKHFG